MEVGSGGLFLFLLTNFNEMLAKRSRCGEEVVSCGAEMRRLCSAHGRVHTADSITCCCKIVRLSKC